MKKIAVYIILLILLVIPVFSQQTQSDLTEVTVLRVIDGDTIELTNRERVRFIGVDAPERGEPGADEATRFVRERVEGLTVWLESDGADRDRFGRLRRYIWLQKPTNPQNENEIRQYQLNTLLLEAGLASVMIVGRVRNETLFRKIASEQITAPATLPEVIQVNFIGNVNSQVFHALNCRSLPRQNNQINFGTREDAIRTGFRACRECRP